MALTKGKPAAAQLNESSLKELALRYVGAYSTTRAKLRSYLERKLVERGWSGTQDPDLERLVDRFAELGYVDDAAYAMSKSRALSARGYGKRRLREKLRIDGVEEQDSVAADAHADDVALETALRFAKRRRLGPFAAPGSDPHQREKWIAAMVRAGHEFSIAREIAMLAPGVEIDLESLRDRCRGFHH